MKKWLVLSAGLVSQTALGGIYAWSAFVPPLMQHYGLSSAQCSLIFGVMIAVFTLATIPAGRFLRALGPRICAALGALLFAAGYVLASFSRGSFPLLLISLGLIGGTGIGFGYVVPISTGMKWFPQNKGLVTGVAVAGFGLGAMLLSALAEWLLYSIDVLVVFRMVGIGFGSIALLAAMCLELPPDSEPNSQTVEQGNSIRSHVFTFKYALVWLGMFTGTFGGLLVSGNLKPLMLTQGLEEGMAVLAIPLFAAGNTLGRLVWGRIHDALASRNTIVLSLATLFLSLLGLALVRSPVPLLFIIVLVGFGFGACFVVYAASIVEYFGIQKLPLLYPPVFVGYGLAALVGPAAGAWSAEGIASFSPALVFSAVLLLLPFFLALRYLPPINSAKRSLSI